MANLWIFVYCFFVSLMASGASGNVLLVVNNATLSFQDIEASFAPSVKGSGICGMLYTAEPLNACKELTNTVEAVVDVYKSPFVLIIRGGCSFEDKVRRAQAAGFKAAIIYDNEYGDLVAMAGSSAGIRIPSIFVSKASAEILSKYAGADNVEVWIIPGFENSAWSIMAISFISLLAMSAVLATCFFVRRHRVRWERPRTSRVREFHGMSSQLVKALPSLIFTAVLEDNCTSSTCAICLEDYNVGDKLRILPCHHKFHALCVDAWLTSWRTFCPVCKRDARTVNGDRPASESTPLLSSRTASISSAALSSFRSTLSSTSAMQIAPASSRSPVSRPLSISSTTYNQPLSFHSYHHQSPHLSISSSSTDLVRRASSQRSRTPYLASRHSIGYPSVSPSQRSRTPYLASPHSIGYPSVSPLDSRYMFAYVPSPGNASSSYYIGSSSQQQNALHCSESAPSFSPFDSAQSLPEC